MTDGTTELSDLAGTTDNDPGAVDAERSEGAFASDDVAGTADPSGEPSADTTTDQQVPDWVQEALSASDPNTILSTFNEKVAEAEKQMKASWTPKLQEAAQARKRAEAVLEQAARYEALMNDPTTAERLLGTERRSEPEEDLPPLAELDLTDEQKALETLRRKLFGGDPKEALEKIAREVYSTTPQAKVERLKAATSQYREALSDAGQEVSNDQFQAALNMWEADLREDGVDWRDTDPQALARNLRPYIRFARNQATKAEPAAKPDLRATPASTGARARTKSVQVWEREGRKPTLEELYDSDAGGVSGAEIDRHLAESQSQLHG